MTPGRDGGCIEPGGRVRPSRERARGSEARGGGRSSSNESPYLRSAFVIPAEAGIQFFSERLGPRFRGDDRAAATPFACAPAPASSRHPAGGAAATDAPIAERTPVRQHSAYAGPPAIRTRLQRL